jgi:hypothetical protein
MLDSIMSLTKHILVPRFYFFAFVGVRFHDPNILVLIVEDLFVDFSIAKMGIGVACWIFVSSTCLHNIGIDPSWSEIKCILGRHDEMAEASREVLHISTNLNDLEQIMADLSNLVRNQAQQIDSLEIECRYLSFVVHSQCSFSVSINQGFNVSHRGGISNEEMGVRDPIQLETEGNSSTNGEHDV